MKKLIKKVKWHIKRPIRRTHYYCPYCQVEVVDEVIFDEPYMYCPECKREWDNLNVYLAEYVRNKK
jgi:Zn-finger nucleic acid-binding protein